MLKYCIYIKCWYPEDPSEDHIEIYQNLEFDTMELAAIYLAVSMEEILDLWPVISVSIATK